MAKTLELHTEAEEWSNSHRYCATYQQLCQPEKGNTSEFAKLIYRHHEEPSSKYLNIIPTEAPSVLFPPLRKPWQSESLQHIHFNVPESKELAFESWRQTTEESPETESMHIYTDGSKTEEGVGAGIFHVDHDGNEQETSLRLHAKATIFDAEALALQYGVKLCYNEKKKVFIFSDSKSVIQAIQSSARNLEWNIFFLQQQLELCKNVDLTIQWIPGHRGIDGNERADALAKAACITGIETEKHWTPSTIKFEILKKARSIWSQRWIKSPNYIPASMATTGQLQKFHENLTKPMIALFHQFRTGHTCLNAHLYRFRKNDTDKCACGCKETTSHFLLDCWLYNDLRQSLRTDIRQILGNSKVRFTTQTLLDHPATALPTLRYIKEALHRRSCLPLGNR